MKPGAVVLADVTTVEVEDHRGLVVQAHGYGDVVTARPLEGDVDRAHCEAVRALMQRLLPAGADLSLVEAEQVGPLEGSTTTVRRWRVSRMPAAVV